MRNLDKQMMKGLNGEYFTVSRFLSWNYASDMITGPFKFDTIVQIDDKILRVQVKTSDRVVNGAYSFDLRPGRSSGRQYRKGEYDIMACVAIKSGRIKFFTFDTAPKGGIEHKIETFNRKEERRTWEECLESLNLKQKPKLS